MSHEWSGESLALAEAARVWIPRLEARADEVEQARRVPDDLARQLASEGFYRMWVPKALGGLELPLVPTLVVLENLAKGDPSVSWCVAIGITSSLVLSALPPSTARQVFATPETILAGVFAPSGRADAVAGGFRVSGQWSFGSGAQNADWVLAGCRYFSHGEPINDEAGNPRTNMVLVPQCELEFLDNWHVMGLCGTGSSDFRLRDVEVTEDFIPGWFPSDRPTSSLFQIPNLTLLAVGFGAIALGLARAALGEFAQLAATKKGTMALDTLAARGAVQSGFARAEAKLRAARSHYYEMAEAIGRAGEAGNVTVEHRADLRLANNHAVEVAEEVTGSLFRLGGGSSIYKRSRLQRLLRDANVITQHVQVRAENYTVIGSHLLGVPRGVGIL